MESEWGSHHRVIKDHHRSARYLSQIKSKPMPGHFAWDSNLSTIHLTFNPAMHQTMVDVFYFEVSSL
jgi:hypothetical protein